MIANKQKQQQKHTTKPQHNGNKELPTTYAHRVSLPKVANNYETRNISVVAIKYMYFRTN
jgi:hypothetical protein